MVEETTQASADTPADERVEVADLDHFVRLLTQWHSRKVQALEHLLNIPEGFIVQIGDEPEMPVTGDIHKGVLLGVNLALMEFGVLPFTAEVESPQAP